MASVSVSMTKSEARKEVWGLLRRGQVIQFPGSQVRVPNFIHADQAARLLGELAVWRRATAVSVCADAPQLFVRRRAVEDGKLLYIATPHLRAEKCFIEIDPKRLGDRALLATNLSAACRYGRLVGPRDMHPIDLIVCGSVAVSRRGIRIGKGGGYGDLEYALLREAGRVRECTPIATTVHPLQIINERIAVSPHDVPVDFLVTPDEVIATRPGHARPRGIYWHLLRPVRINTIPLLRKRLSELQNAGRPIPRRL
jgi:5-formyltetrahydrofolate cyclo-ligase